MRDLDSVMAKIRKLLTLAERAANEHEAANAAARAAELMASYQIEEATIRASASSDAPAEEIVTDHTVYAGAKNKSAWRITVASAVAKSYGARCYLTGPVVKVFGRRSAVQATEYTVAYLLREIDALAERNVAGRGKGWANSFRLGAAACVASRLAEAQREQAQREQAQREQAQREQAQREQAQRGALSGSATASSGTTTLAVIAKDRAEVEAEYSKFSRKFRSARLGGASSASGYAAGYSAGGSVSLGGGRGGLGAGAKGLRG
jgi:hypothetical protein